MNKHWTFIPICGAGMKDVGIVGSQTGCPGTCFGIKTNGSAFGFNTVTGYQSLVQALVVFLGDKSSSTGCLGSFSFKILLSST